LNFANFVAFSCRSFVLSFEKQDYTMKISNNKILITGGATGIGLGLTKRFLEENNTVIIIGRRESALKEVSDAYPEVITKVCDLSDENERITLYNWVTQNHPDLNVLINNAGVQNWMGLDDAEFLQRARQEIVTNIEAPLHLTSLFSELPSLTTLINVTSGLAFVPAARIAVYSATKAFFRSFTLSTRYLLAKKNIEVIELIPPALNTGLGGQGLHDAFPPVSDFVASVFNDLKAGKTEITFGTSEPRAAIGREENTLIFNTMNP
jgi:uncharacterized oxidoreductase